MRKRWLIGAAILIAGALFALNTSLLARPQGELSLLAHRGVHQRFDPAGVDDETCTATRIYPPTHGYIENTLPSIKAAFAVGADLVEIDIHPTTDGEFVVFHDWTLECRTDGRGVTREHSLAELKALDVGYGYTADGGKTYPLRGSGVGLMPTLSEVLAAFPGRAFHLNVKSNDASEADKLHAYLRRHPGAQVAVFAGERPAHRLRALAPDMRIGGRRLMMACAKDYMLTGWLGLTPSSCRNTIVYAPANYAWLAWGWPNRLLERMQRAGTSVYIVGPIGGGRAAGAGVDDAQTWALVPPGWRGGVMTDAVEVVGPLAKKPDS